ncbi:uncharacterized protein Dvir_GJ26322 [Drosophila virilis]|uniref:Uncharacterized protein n=1 Tax=Drosophila virilis TaxID=7244 RepID=A0A0Q9WQX5_DROVI|nr:uncharacterized protein Dvir_GJ26322 [Drosophila virilis]
MGQMPSAAGKANQRPDWGQLTGRAKDYLYLYAKQQPKTDNNNNGNNNIMRHCTDTSQLPFKVSQEQDTLHRTRDTGRRTQYVQRVESWLQMATGNRQASREFDSKLRRKWTPNVAVLSNNNNDIDNIKSAVLCVGNNCVRVLMLHVMAINNNENSSSNNNNNDNNQRIK